MTMKLQELLDNSKTKELEPEFSFDLEEMKAACAGPSYNIPHEVLDTFESFQAFMMKGSDK